MSILKAKKIRGALQKVLNVGRVEESVVIDGCTIVLRPMSPQDYDAILNETKDLEGAEYLHEYQLGYICRAIAEIEGVDLRDVEFVEEDVPTGAYYINATVSSEAKALAAKELLAKVGVDLRIVPPEEDEGSKTVLLERHEWLRNQLRTWSQEAVAVAWRKYADVVASGEAQALSKVAFRTPVESPEDKFRRLLTEAKALEAELPPDMTTAILAEVEYLQKTSQAELDDTSARLREISVSSVEPELRRPEVAYEDPTPRRNSSVGVPEPKITSPKDVLFQEPLEANTVRQGLTPEELAERIRTRTPLNRVEEVPFRPSARASQIAALEAVDLHDPDLVSRPIVREALEVAEVSKKAPIDASKIQIDAPPSVGINPRFRPPPRHG